MASKADRVITAPSKETKRDQTGSTLSGPNLAAAAQLGVTEEQFLHWG